MTVDDDDADEAGAIGVNETVVDDVEAAEVGVERVAMEPASALPKFCAMARRRAGRSDDEAVTAFGVTNADEATAPEAAVGVDRA